MQWRKNTRQNIGREDCGQIMEDITAVKNYVFQPGNAVIKVEL